MHLLLFGIFLTSSYDRFLCLISSAFFLADAVTHAVNLFFLHMCTHETIKTHLNRFFPPSSLLSFSSLTFRSQSANDREEFFRSMMQRKNFEKDESKLVLK